MRFKKHLTVNEDTQTVSIGTEAYYDNLPKGLTGKIVDKVHQYDSDYLSSALVYAHEHRVNTDDNSYVEVKTPILTASVAYEKDQETHVVLKTNHDGRTALAKAIKRIKEEAKPSSKKTKKTKKKTKENVTVSY